jgi:hypothetical protein
MCGLFKYVFNSRDYTGMQTVVRELHAACTCLKTEENQENLCRDGPSQDLPDAY